ncbi:MAG: T9SS type A sorting domain-containing protein, partial [Saprospiraceae bacterium]|nr:T9SS type A sorting domain-containing protein [Saprospiraceae bacterium]
NLVVNGVNFIVMPTTDLKLDNGGVTNTNSANISNEGNIYIDLDWTQTGLFTSYSGNGWMWYEGSVDQTLSAPSLITVPKLRVDNGQKLILAQHVDVSTSVDLMNNGKIQLGTNNLTVSPAGSISNYDANNFIITNDVGFVEQTVNTGSTIVFPIGTAATSYTPATLTNIGTSEIFEVRVHDQALQYGNSGPALTDHVVDKTWLINDVGVGAPNIDLKLQWNISEELGSFARTSCGIAHKEVPGSWNNPPLPAGFGPATSVTATSYERSRSGFTTFSPFIVRDDVIFLSSNQITFDANRINVDFVKLDWQMSSETDNKGFEVERMLDNETSFKFIGFVQGNGTTTNSTNYNYDDLNSYTGLSYYRLKQINFDGQYTYSQVRVVDGLKDDNPTYIDISTYPNPVLDEIFIEFKKIPKDVKSATVEISNVAGQILYRVNHDISYNHLIKIDYVDRLVPAAYMITVDLGNGYSVTQKFIKKDN